MRCLTPISIKNKKTGNMEHVPCNRCLHCLKRKVSQWSFRLVQEYNSSQAASFVTLTYNTESVPITEHCFMTLRKKDLQDYMKRLRYHQEQIDWYYKKILKESGMEDDGVRMPKIKYYAVGEYGSTYERPHYHIILFNADDDIVVSAWNNQGEVHIGEVNVKSIGYCLDYIVGIGDIPKHQRDDRINQFALMSKGLGKSYITKRMIKWHLAKTIKVITPDGELLTYRDRYYCVLPDGKKISMPRYYQEKMIPKIYRDIDKAKMIEKMDQESFKDKRTEHDKQAVVYNNALKYSKLKKKKNRF